MTAVNLQVADVDNCIMEDHIRKIVAEIQKTDAIEEAFSCFIVRNSGNGKWQRNAYQEELKTLFSNTAPESLETAVRTYISAIASLRGSKQLPLLFSILESLVHSSILPAKLVCEVLLTCEHLQYQDDEFWCAGFGLIGHIINMVDYKGVRDLLKVILDKAKALPYQFNVALCPQMKSLEEVVNFIFDRNKCLLPSYFIVNEIQKLYPDNLSWPHWKLASMLSDFVESFRSTAQMVSIAGRSKLLPVIGHTGTVGNVWKLDPVTLRFPLRGTLPYDQELLEPRTDLLRYVIEQPYSRDTVCNMLNLTKQNKQRSAVLEEQLIDLVVLAMESTENETEPCEDNGTGHLLWQHLSSQLIYFVLFQFASFPHMVSALHDKLAARNLRKGRDHLMWVLLQFISGSIQKNPLTDFLPMMKLYELLYPEKEPLPLPDINRAICIPMNASSKWSF